MKIISVCALNTVPNVKKKKLKGKTENSTITLAYFNTTHSVINKITKQKTRKDINELKNTINKYDLCM